VGTRNTTLLEIADGSDADFREDGYLLLRQTTRTA
jgi:hypothetical protein